jgi:hypothetical protein
MLLSVLLGGLAGLSLCAWSLAWAGAAPGIAAAVTVLGALACGLLARRALALGVGELAWDGTRWTWMARGGSDGVEARPTVAFDLGPWLLLRLVPVAQGATAWVAVSQDGAGAAWGSWRAALYAQAAGVPGSAPEPET